MLLDLTWEQSTKKYEPPIKQHNQNICIFIIVYKRTPTENESQKNKKKTQYADLSRSIPAARNSAALKLYFNTLNTRGQ